MPHETQVRWASDQLELSFLSGAVAITRLAFWQVPWEIDQPEGEEAKQSARAYLYRHKLNVPGGPIYWRYTDYAQSITVTEDAEDVTYFPAQIEHDRFSQGFMLDDDAVKLWIYGREANNLIHGRGQILS